MAYKVESSGASDRLENEPLENPYAAPGTDRVALEELTEERQPWSTDWFHLVLAGLGGLMIGVWVGNVEFRSGVANDIDSARRLLWCSLACLGLILLVYPRERPSDQCMGRYMVEAFLMCLTSVLGLWLINLTVHPEYILDAVLSLSALSLSAFGRFLFVPRWNSFERDRLPIGK